MNQLECALRTALDVHEGQLDKGGSPYILHPIRVMMQMETEPERVVALLHDSVEDGDEFDLAQVEAKFGGKIASAVEAITKRENEPYQTYTNLNIAIKDRFGNPVVPREWFLVPLPVIDEAVERIKDGTITDFRYDPRAAALVKTDGSGK